MIVWYNVAGCLEINPSKSLYGAISRILNGPGTKSRLFEVPETFLAQKNVGPLEKARFSARTHLESLSLPHLVIWQGRFYKSKLDLQHSCINSYMQRFFNSF